MVARHRESTLCRRLFAAALAKLPAVDTFCPMTAEAYFLLRKGDLVSDLRDLDDVALLCDALTRAGDTIPGGTEGTIVGVHDDGIYEVEFAEPDGALATVEGRNLRLVRSFAE